MKDAPAAKRGVQPRRRVYRAPTFMPLWALIGGAAVVALIGTYPYYGSNAYVLSLLGKFLCFAIFALSIDLIWGFTGILSLGQAVYFGIGAYFVALSLKINYAMTHPTRYGGNFPDFMEWNGLTELPGFMTPLISTPFAVLCALVVPTLLALSVRRDHLQAPHLRRLLRGDHARRVAYPPGLHHRVSGLYRRLQRHNRLLELRHARRFSGSSWRSSSCSSLLRAR